jgi:hypothetical protein
MKSACRFGKNTVVSRFAILGMLSRAALGDARGAPIAGEAKRVRTTR